MTKTERDRAEGLKLRRPRVRAEHRAVKAKTTGAKKDLRGSDTKNRKSEIPGMPAGRFSPKKVCGTCTPVSPPGLVPSPLETSQGTSEACVFVTTSSMNHDRAADTRTFLYHITEISTHSALCTTFKYAAIMVLAPYGVPSTRFALSRVGSQLDRYLSSGLEG